MILIGKKGAFKRQEGSQKERYHQIFLYYKIYKKKNYKKNWQNRKVKESLLSSQ